MKLMTKDIRDKLLRNGRIQQRLAQESRGPLLPCTLMYSGSIVYGGCP
jgi:hypothetical protein